MLDILSNLIARDICSKIRVAKHFAIQCDKVTSHKRALMSVISRYTFHFKISEQCVKLVQISSLTGKSLIDVVLAAQNDIKLSLKSLISKAFDGATDMLGIDKNMQQHFLHPVRNFWYIFIVLHTNHTSFSCTVWKTYQQ